MRYDAAMYSATNSGVWVEGSVNAEYTFTPVKSRVTSAVRLTIAVDCMLSFVSSEGCFSLSLRAASTDTKVLGYDGRCPREEHCGWMHTCICTCQSSRTSQKVNFTEEM